MLEAVLATANFRGAHPHVLLFGWKHELILRTRRHSSSVSSLSFFTPSSIMVDPGLAELTETKLPYSRTRARWYCSFVASQIRPRIDPAVIYIPRRVCRCIFIV